VFGRISHGRGKRGGAAGTIGREKGKFLKLFLSTPECGRLGKKKRGKSWGERGGAKKDSSYLVFHSITTQSTGEKRKRGKAGLRKGGKREKKFDNLPLFFPEPDSRKKRKKRGNSLQQREKESASSGKAQPTKSTSAGKKKGKASPVKRGEDVSFSSSPIRVLKRKERENKQQRLKGEKRRGFPLSGRRPLKKKSTIQQFHGGKLHSLPQGAIQGGEIGAGQNSSVSRCIISFFLSLPLVEGGGRKKDQGWKGGSPLLISSLLCISEREG